MAQSNPEELEIGTVTVAYRHNFGAAACNCLDSQRYEVGNVLVDKLRRRKLAEGVTGRRQSSSTRNKNSSRQHQAALRVF